MDTGEEDDEAEPTGPVHLNEEPDQAAKPRDATRPETADPYPQRRKLRIRKRKSKKRALGGRTRKAP